MSIPEPFDIVDFANDMLSSMAMVRNEFEDPNDPKDDNDEQEDESESSIDYNDDPDEWGNDYGSPMHGIPPDGDPYWDNNEEN